MIMTILHSPELVFSIFDHFMVRLSFYTASNFRQNFGFYMLDCFRALPTRTTSTLGPSPYIEQIPRSRTYTGRAL